MILLAYANMLALGNMNRNRPRQKPVDPGNCIRFALGGHDWRGVREVKGDGLRNPHE
jgi:hypothetical protein